MGKRFFISPNKGDVASHIHTALANPFKWLNDDTKRMGGLFPGKKRRFSGKKRTSKRTKKKNKKAKHKYKKKQMLAALKALGGGKVTKGKRRGKKGKRGKRRK
jgi:hypothetical protein